MVRPWCLGGGRQTQHWRLNRWRPNPCFPPWASGADPHRVPRHRSGSRRARRLHKEDRAGRMAQDVAAGTAARRPSPPLIRADHDRMCSGCRSHLQDGRCRIAHHDATLRSNPTPTGEADPGPQSPCGSGVEAGPRASAKPGWSWNAGSGATGVAAPDRRSGQPPIATAPLTSLAPQASSHSRSRLGGFSSTLRGPITAPERVCGRSPLQR